VVLTFDFASYVNVIVFNNDSTNGKKIVSQIVENEVITENGDIDLLTTIWGPLPTYNPSCEFSFEIKEELLRTLNQKTTKFIGVLCKANERLQNVYAKVCRLIIMTQSVWKGK
jgi:hypothetical protein